MNEERKQLDRLIDTGTGLSEIERRIDDAQLDDESKAVVWLRAYSARIDQRRIVAIEETWQSNRVASG